MLAPGPAWRGRSSRTGRRPPPRWPTGSSSLPPPYAATSTTWSPRARSRRASRARSTAPAAGAGRPRSSRSPRPVATASTSSTTTWPSQALRFLAETGGDEAVRAFARRRVGVHRGALPSRSPTQPRPSAGRGAGPGAHRRGLRRVGARPRRPIGRAAVPAALPGGPRRPRVPAAVRGRDRGVRPGARHATSSGWPPSPTATASAPPTSRTTQRLRPRSVRARRQMTHEQDRRTPR